MQRRYLVVSTVATGLALLTKPPGVVVGLLFVGLGAVTAWQCSERRGRAVRSVLLWSVLVGMVFVACWPAMWIDPVGRVAAMAQFILVEGTQPHEGGTFFLGQPMRQDPGVLFYPVVFALRLGLMPCIGLACLVLVHRADVRLAAILGLVAYVLLFVAVMSLGAKKLD